MKTSILTLVIIACYFCTVHAHQICTAPCDGIDPKKISIKGIKLSESTFEDAFKTFGKAQIYAPYDNRSQYICYTSSDTDDNTAVIFSAYTSSIDTVEIFKYKNQVLPMMNCTKSDAVNDKISFDSGLKLDASYRDFSKKKYKILFNGFEEMFIYECYIDKIHCTQPLELTIRMQLIKDKVYYIKATHSDICN